MDIANAAINSLGTKGWKIDYDMSVFDGAVATVYLFKRHARGVSTAIVEVNTKTLEVVA